MARRATGAVVRSKSGAYALRFTAYGERRYVTLGTEAEGWTPDRAEAELQNVQADVRRGRWTPPSPNVALAPEPTDDPTFHVRVGVVRHARVRAPRLNRGGDPLEAVLRAASAL